MTGIIEAKNIFFRVRYFSFCVYCKEKTKIIIGIGTTPMKVKSLQKSFTGMELARIENKSDKVHRIADIINRVVAFAPIALRRPQNIKAINADTVTDTLEYIT
jgi:hypothetical protein